MDTGKHIKVRHMGEKALGVTLEGNPQKPEPDHFRVCFPGGDVDLTRCDDGSYWVHVYVNRPEAGHMTPDKPTARLTAARIDIHGKHASEVDAGDFGHEKAYHVAVRVKRD